MFEITPQNYNALSQPKRKALREQYVIAQKGLCWHCQGALTKKPTGQSAKAPIDWKLFPPGFLGHPVHLHHNHVTGMTIGAVHSRCNAWLWQYKGQ